MRSLFRQCRPLALGCLGAAALGCAGCSSGTARVPPPAAGRAEILWDRWGIPHVYASDTEGLFRAFGWAQAHSHGDLLLRLYGQARGRAAEYWGREYLESDGWLRTMGVPARAAEWYDRQGPEFRRYLDAFAAGVNAYARAHPDRITDSLERVLPVTAADVLAHTQRVIHFGFVTSPGAVAAAGRQWRAAGSNAWAIAPSRSASGHALLLANPHLPWSDFYVFYEAHLTAPGINVYGATLVGFPGVGIGFNEHLGWTHTVNTFDGQDLFELTLVDGGYRWDGATRSFETAVETLSVRQPDGRLSRHPLTVRRSVHGPVVAERPGKALALRVVGLDRAHLLEQWWAMARATTLAEFEAAVGRLQLPMFTVMYADRAGHIMHLFNGLTPVRSRGDWTYWAGAVPGDTSALLWTRTHSYAELPRVVDPPSGWLQNANDPPWTTTFPAPFRARDFPAYMAPNGMAFRPQRSARMLSEDERITFDELVRYKHSTRLELADRLLDDLLPAARASTDGLARAAADVLARWDRSADAESRGAVLFSAWVDEAARRAGGRDRLFAHPWTPDSPLTTPDGLADAAAAVAALSAAAARVRADHGSPDVAWGDVFRLRRDGVDLPANGGPGGLGIFRVLGFTQAPDRRYVATSGDTFVAAIEFSTPVRAVALLSYGNASQPGSPHRTDQLPLFARKELRPVWLTRAEVEAHLEAREEF